LPLEDLFLQSFKNRKAAARDNVTDLRVMAEEGEKLVIALNGVKVEEDAAGEDEEAGKEIGRREEDKVVEIGEEERFREGSQVV